MTYERLEIVAVGTTGSGLLLRDGSTLRDTAANSAGPVAAGDASFTTATVADDHG